MKIDIELLELAAKAAGIKVATAHERGLYLASAKWWNPLTDDGDALRLAVELGLEIVRSRITDKGLPVVSCHKVYEDVHEEDRWQWQFIEDDPCAATRRAIVRAAAAMGEAMP